MTPLRSQWRRGELLALSLALSASIFVRASLIPARPAPPPRLLAVLAQVLRGPARERLLVVHVDAALLPWTRAAVLGVAELRNAPHLTLTLGAAPLWTPGPHALPASALHLAVFLEPRAAHLQALWQLWRPRNLLLLSLADTGEAAVLRDASLASVHSLALIASLGRRGAAGPATAGVYTVFPLSSGVPRLLAPWNPDAFPDWHSLFPDRFPTFHGHTLQVAGWAYDWPFLHTYDPREVSGVCLKLLQLLATSLNFSPEYTWMDKLESFKTNGSWSGPLGEVYRGAANLSATMFLLEEHLNADFEITKPFWTDGFSAFLVKRKATFTWAAPLRPFQAAVWLAVAAAATAAVLFVTLQGAVIGRGRSSVASSWLFVQRGLLAQGVPVLPQAMWLKACVTGWYAFCFLITVSYTTNLVAILTTPVAAPHPRTLLQLAASHYRLAMEDFGSSLPGRLSTSHDSMYRRLGGRLDLFPSVPDALRAMIEGTHVYVDSTTYSRGLIRSKYKVYNATRLEEEMFPGHTVWVFAKDVPWRHSFDRVLSRLVECGILHHWYLEEIMKLQTLTRLEDKEKQESEKKTEKNEGHDENGGNEEEGEGGEGRGGGGSGRTEPLSLRHLRTMFTVLSFSYILGGLVLTIEILTHRRSERVHE